MKNINPRDKDEFGNGNGNGNGRNVASLLKALANTLCPSPSIPLDANGNISGPIANNDIKSDSEFIAPIYRPELIESAVNTQKVGEVNHVIKASECNLI